MKHMPQEVSFSFNNALVPAREQVLSKKRLASLARKMADMTRDYSTPESAVDLCLDATLHKKIHALIRKIRASKPALLIVIGIGGSNLGMMAIEQLVHGKLHNENTRTIKVLYADTVDSDELAEIKSVMQKTLEKKQTVIINAISKSGTTTETIANFEVLLDVIKKHDKRYREHVIITADEGTPLYTLAQQEAFHVLTIPRAIGGRYSVLTAAGLFPLELAGISIDQLLAGARAMRTRCLKKENNPAITSAAMRYWQAVHAKPIQDLFLFGNDFKSLGKWHRQLFAESLGKGCDKEGKLCIGITPTYSIGSTDMHSIAQLYLGGPFDKFTTFVRVQKNRNDIKTPNYPAFDALVPHIQSTSLQTIMNAIYKGVTETFRERKRPFTEITLPDKSPYVIGQFIQFEMMEVVYLAELLNVNPFDQPDIESYKKKTKEILASKH